MKKILLLASILSTTLTAGNSFAAAGVVGVDLTWAPLRHEAVSRVPAGAASPAPMQSLDSVYTEGFATPVGKGIAHDGAVTATTVRVSGRAVEVDYGDLVPLALNFSQ